MPIVSKTLEVAADEASILSIVADFEAYPQWNEEVKGCWILHRYDDGLLLCELCRPLTRVADAREEVMRHSEHGHTVRAVQRIAA